MSENKTVEKGQEAGAATVRGAREVVEAGLDEAREGFEEATEKLSESARRTRREMRRRAERFGEATRERYDKAVVGVKTGYEKVRKDAGELAEEVNAYVRENPGKSILIAAGAGFVLGMLLRGGRRRDD